METVSVRQEKPSGGGSRAKSRGRGRQENELAAFAPLLRNHHDYGREGGN